MTYAIMGRRDSRIGQSRTITTTDTLPAARRVLNQYRQRFPDRWRFWIKGQPKEVSA